MIRGDQHSSCPALCQASTPIFVEATKAWMARLRRSEARFGFAQAGRDPERERGEQARP